MKRATLAALALLASADAHANGFIDLGLGAVLRDADQGYDFDTGKAAWLELGTLYESGLLLRVGYGYTSYERLELDTVLIVEDIATQEVRLGVFHSTQRGAPLGWRLGGGYAYSDEDDSAGPSRSQRGGFVEAAAVVEAGRRVMLDFAGALTKLGGEADYDAEGAELRAMATFRARALDFTLGARYAVIDRETPFDEQLFELRVGVGGLWAYPEGARY